MFTGRENQWLSVKFLKAFQDVLKELGKHILRRIKKKFPHENFCLSIEFLINQFIDKREEQLQSYRKRVWQHF